MKREITFEQFPQVVHQMSERLERMEIMLEDLTNQSTPEPAERLLSIQEAAEFLGLSVPTIYSKVNRGELPVMKQGNRLYFSNLELMSYVKSGRKRTNKEVLAAAEKYINSGNS